MLRPKKVDIDKPRGYVKRQLRRWSRRIQKGFTRQESVLTCLDCDAVYGDDRWCDVIIPNEIWNAICDSGVLCFACMTQRLVEYGYRGVPVAVVSGPYADRNESWRLIGLEHGRKQALRELAQAEAKDGLYDKIPALFADGEK